MIFDLSIANHYFTGGVTIALSQRSITGRVRTKTINLFNKLCLHESHFIFEFLRHGLKSSSLAVLLYATSSSVFATLSFSSILSLASCWKTSTCDWESCSRNRWWKIRFREDDSFCVSGLVKPRLEPFKMTIKERSNCWKLKYIMYLKLSKAINGRLHFLILHNKFIEKLFPCYLVKFTEGFLLLLIKCRKALAMY